MNTLQNTMRVNKQICQTMYSVQNPFYRDPQILILNP